MMELNREQIIKALECCNKTNCKECPYTPSGKVDIFDITCSINMARDTLALIKELTEENEWIKEHSLVLTISEGDIIRTSKNVSLKTLGHPDPVGKPGICGLYKQCQADTVRKMRERLEYSLCCIPQCHFTYAEVQFHIDRIAKEMLEGNK